MDSPKVSQATSIAPWLSVRNSAQAVAFYKSALGAVEVYRLDDPDGNVVARLSVDGAEFWVADESPQHFNFSPESLAGAWGAWSIPTAITGRLAGRSKAPEESLEHHPSLNMPPAQALTVRERRGAMNLWEASDLTLPWCLRVVATLRIAEQISADVTRIDDLAAAVLCNSTVLGSVLQYLVGKGIFESPQPGVFQLNDAAQGLLDPATHLGLDLNGIGGRMAGSWVTLLSYVRTGIPAYKDAFGLPFWEDLEAHPEIAASFDAMMGPAGHGEFNADFEISSGWGNIQTVVDVGGGTGDMLAALLRLRPQLRGTLVDLPGTVKRAAQTFRSAAVEDRVNRVGQSFFDPLPPGADLYMLRKVLNNWDDANAIALLRRCADAARPNGRVIVLKGVEPDAVPHQLSISSLLVGGKDRSISEFRALAAESGLTVVQAQQQSSGYFVVECRVI